MPDPALDTAKRYARFGPYLLDLQTGELRKHDLRLKLQQQPFQILALLLEAPGDLVTRERLREHLWPGGTFVDFEHGLSAAVQKLRDTLSDPAAKPVYVETLPKRGYRFIGEVIFAVSATGVAPQLDAKGPHDAISIATNRGPRIWFGVLQVMYMIFYVITLARFEHIGEGALQADWLRSNLALGVIITSALVGTAARLFFLSGVSLAFAHTAKVFLQVFPVILVLDELWALSPFLIERQLGIGIAFACFVALAWSPFAQRTLLRLSSVE